MKKHYLIVAGMIIAVALSGCGTGGGSSTAVTGGADAAASIRMMPTEQESKDADKKEEDVQKTDEKDADLTAADEKAAEVKESEAKADAGEYKAGKEASAITDEQALAAIKNYCLINNPDLERIVNEGEYPVYWEISSSDEQSIVVVFRSYTGSLNYYYIDPVSGDTYVTEYVPAIMDEEQKTDETLNVREYMK